MRCGRKKGCCQNGLRGWRGAARCAGRSARGSPRGGGARGARDRGRTLNVNIALMRAGGPEARVQRRDLRGEARAGRVQGPGSARASLQSRGGRGSGKRVWSWRFEARRRRRCPGGARARPAPGRRPPIDCERRRAPARPAGRPTQPIWRWAATLGHAPRARGRRIGPGALWVRRNGRKLWAWRAPGPGGGWCTASPSRSGLDLALTRGD